MYSAQQRYEEYKQIKKQMYKIHLPHLESGYLKKVDHETTLNSEGKQDWIFHYTPGPKAEAEFRAFNGKHATIADSLDRTRYSRWRPPKPARPIARETS